MKGGSVKELIDQIKRLSPVQKVVALAVIAIVLWLLRHILLLITAIVVIALLVWFLAYNQIQISTSIVELFCVLGGC
jgi:hypothetical protein